MKLLLDEHISRDVARAFTKLNKSVPIFALPDFEGGRLLGLSDEKLLTQAHREGLTLVTFDLRTIPELLKRWSEENRSHAGVIFISEKTVPASDFGGIARAISKLVAHCPDNWENRCVFLLH